MAKSVKFNSDVCLWRVHESLCAQLLTYVRYAVCRYTGNSTRRVEIGYVQRKVCREFEVWHYSPSLVSPEGNLYSSPRWPTLELLARGVQYTVRQLESHVQSHRRCTPLFPFPTFSSFSSRCGILWTKSRANEEITDYTQRAIPLVINSRDSRWKEIRWLCNV